MTRRREAVVQQISRLRRYARALTGDEAEADDLIQDTLERALTRLDQWREGDDPCKWLLSILHNLHVDGVRRKSRRPLHVGLENVGADTSSDAAEGASTGDIDRALQLLSVGQRQVLLLAGVQGLSYAETAEVLSIPIGTVMSRLARGRDRMRLLLAGGDMLKSAVKGDRAIPKRARMTVGRLLTDAADWRPPQRQ